MTRGTLHYGSGNVAKVWVDDSGDGITASTGRPLSAVKFRVFAGKYESDVLPQMKPASQASIKSVLSRLCESFGDRRLSDIGTEEIQKFITGSPSSPRTLKNQVGVFRMVWTKARAWGYVRHNPFEFLSMPRQPLPVARTLSVEEVRAIVRKTDEPFKTMLMILSECGLRGGELVALQTSDVDITNRVINVRRSAFRKRTQSPKTSNAIRAIHISPYLATHIALYLTRRNTTAHDQTGRDEARQDENFLFPYKDGCWDNGEVLRRLKPILGEDTGLHSFRHFNKSLMQSLGMPEYLQDERMGHSGGGIGRKYTHSLPEDHRRWAEVIGRELCTENVQRAYAGGD